MPTSSRHDFADHASDDLLSGAAVDPLELLDAERATQRRRGRQRLVAVMVAFLLFVGVAALIATVGISGTTGSTGAAAPKLAVNAEAVGVLVIRPGEEAERLAASRLVVGAREQAEASHASWSIEGIATVERAATRARAQVAGRTAAAAATVERVSFLDGRVELRGASLTADARSSDGRADGALVLAPSTQLVVDGTPRAAKLNERIAIEGIGTLIVNEQAVLASAPTGDAQTGPRHRVVGAIAHLRITQQVGDLPAGSEIVVGRVDAGIREGKVREVAHPVDEPQPVTPAPLPGIQSGLPAPGESTLPRRSTAVRANAPAAAAANLQGYLFPVLGSHSYTNDWGAPRASTGRGHEGNDIFAAEGTPIVAVADGVLDRVGWNSIGGYRFWLFDQYGNAFYHAHLSAFSPLAQDGARVRRGDVIGFVGHTGDAQYTPPHLHFEIHPGNGGPTNPYPFLGAWKQGVAVAIGLLTTGPERIAPMSLLGFTDIGANSGLQASVLDTVPDTRARTIDQESAPRPTDESLKGAIEGPGTTPAS